MLDPTPSSSAQPGSSNFPLRPGTARGGAVGRIITDGEVAGRTLDRPRETGSQWETPGLIEASDAADARAARSEARRALFAIAGELDRAERALAAARTSGDSAAIAEAERRVAGHAASLNEHAQRANELKPVGRETITPERVFALLAWKQRPSAGDDGTS